MLAELIEKIASFEPREQPFYPRPSMAGPEKCLRQLVYKARKFPEKKRADRFYLVLDDSSWHEELTLDWLRKSAFKVHSEQLQIECGVVMWEGQPFVVKGHIDGIVTDLNGKDYLLEHKAVNHFSFERYLKEEYPMDYLTQCVLYIVGLQKINPEIRNGILLIKNKNTSQYLEFNLFYDIHNDLLVVNEIIGSNGYRRDGKEFQNLYKNALDRLNQIEEHRKNQTLPPRQYSPNDWQCSYCGFDDICYKDYQEEINNLTTIEIPSEFQKDLEEYETLIELQKEMEKRIEEIKEKLKNFLISNNAKVGLSSVYRVTRDIITRKVLNKEKIPTEILKNAEEEKIIETIKIKKINTRR